MRRLTRRQRLAALVLGVLALGFIALDLGGGSLRSAHDGARGVVGALYRGTDAVVGPVRRFVAGVPHAATNQATIEALRRDNNRLQAQLDQQAAGARDAEALARLQGAATATGRAVVPARVIALGAAQGFDWTVTLDVGRRDGIEPGQTVTDGSGLVGRVLRVDDSSTLVLLAADPGSGVGARDERSGELGVATGLASRGFRLVPLDPDADLQAGDRLVTGPSGATSFVPGLTIGTITEVRRSATGVTTAEVRAAVSPTRLDVLGVIVTGTPGAGAAGTAGARVALQPQAGAR